MVWTGLPVFLATMEPRLRRSEAAAIATSSRSN